MARRSNRIPAMRPLLPTADKIQKYLEEIDKNRWYSNLGPLTFRLEERLAELFQVPSNSLITLSNGTAGLSVILRSLDIPAGSFCIIPSWTFVATAAAATEVGLQPFFVDVEKDTWSLKPDNLKKQLRYIPGKVGAVIVVSPFGAPVPIAPWDEFTAETGVPVIIDGAAAFDATLQYEECRQGNTPVMISMHATRTFGIGEGAFMLCQNKQLVHRVREMSNFGFSANREIVVPGINARLNEYNAAVGLAELDGWAEKRAKWLEATTLYIEAFAKANHPQIQHRLSKDWVSSVCNAQVPPGASEHIIESLALASIEARKWWIKGCHEQLAYKHCQHFATPITNELTDSVIALPFSVDITAEEVNYVVEELVEVLRHISL